MSDQKAMPALGEAVAGLADNPYPAKAFHRGEYHRLRVGPYRVIYVVDDDVITIERVDRPSL
jgi:mRNA-degrading endonuclease RelE of RelBE toxin-antitoxin system